MARDDQVSAGRAKLPKKVELSALNPTGCCERWMGSTGSLCDHIEHAPFGLLVLDRTGRVLAVNERAIRITGYNAEELLAQTYGQFFSAAEKESVPEDWARLLETGEIQREIACDRPDGARYWLSCYAVRISEDRLAAYLTDITDQRRGKQELQLLRTAIEQADNSIVITNPGGTIQYVNPAFESVTGYSKEEALGQNPRILASGQHDPSFYGELWSTILEGRIWSGNIINRKKDGTLYTEEMTISPVRDGSGRTRAFVAIKRDVTELLEKTRELEQAQKMEAVGRLAGGVAHDFNNLLTIIQGCCSFVMSGLATDSALRQDVEMIESAGMQAAALTRQLLAFSRRQLLQPEITNLNQIVMGVTEMIGRLIGEDISLETELYADLWSCKVDVGQIEQVLMNLAVNARDAMPRGGKLVLGTANHEVGDATGAGPLKLKPGSYVLLTVRDTGLGMSEEVRNLAFEPFFTTKEVGVGTGLGLSTVEGIVHQSGGHITVESEVDHGAEFLIYFPREAGEITTSPLPEIQAARKSQGETILVVEDNDMVRAMAVRMLETQGYRVFQARSYTEAMFFCRSRARIDLVLTDVVMPQGSGTELARELNRLMPELPVIYMTGYTDEAVMRHDALADRRPILQKPFTAESLGRIVRRALQA